MRLIGRSASRPSIRDIGSGRPGLPRVTATFVRAIPPTRLRSRSRSFSQNEPFGEGEVRWTAGERNRKMSAGTVSRAREKRARGHACVRAYVYGPPRVTWMWVRRREQRTTYRPRHGERVKCPLCRADNSRFPYPPRPTPPRPYRLLSPSPLAALPRALITIAGKRTDGRTAARDRTHVRFRVSGTPIAGGERPREREREIGTWKPGTRSGEITAALESCKR